MKPMNAKTTILLLILTLLTACHTRPPRIDCDGQLKPINTPAPVTLTSEKRS
jgi:starvation-inducible outer membrane lipoprotein